MAAASITISLTGEGGGISEDGLGTGGYGNSIIFDDWGGTLTVTAYGETGPETPSGSLYYLFEKAETWSWASGIGSCNNQEGTVGDGCDDTEHEVDTVNRDDLVVFEFDQVVNFENLTVDPYNSYGQDANDRDIIYWVGNAMDLPDLTTETFATLDDLAGFSDETHESASSGFLPFTHDLSGTGNILLVAGNYHDLSCKDKQNSKKSCEAYKIKDIRISTVVPLPAAFWFIASGLLMLGSRARFAKKQ